MKRWYIVACFCALALLTSCASTGAVSNVREKSMQIRPGTSAQEVLALLGTPGDRSFKGKAEAWQYCSTGFSQDQYITVWLYESQVVSLTTYRASEAMGVCTQAFSSVDWGQAPDDLKVKLTLESK